MLKKILGLIVMVIIMQFSTISFASSIPMTKESLSKAIENNSFSEFLEEQCEIYLKDNKIYINIDDISYELKYDLKDKPKFILEVLIENGMSYDEYEKLTNNYGEPFSIVYALFAEMQGVKLEDAHSYFIFSIAASAFGNMAKEDWGNTYMIIDDANSNWIVTSDDDSNVIYTSKFPDKAVEYADALQKEYCFSDYPQVNSYELTTKKDVTKKYCKLTYEMIINPEAPFVFVTDTMSKLSNSFSNTIAACDADYLVTLKVGDSYKIDMLDGIDEYSWRGDSIKLDDRNATISAIKPGISTLEVTVENSDEEKIFYIIVKEEYESRFIDVPVNSWSYNAIDALYEGGLVSGVGNNKFSPDRGMKVSEFCQIFAKAFGLISGADGNGYWAGKAIKSCIDNGYIYSRGKINSQNYEEIITREEAVAALQMASARMEKAGKCVTLNDIPDGEQISQQYRDLIVAAYNSGITTGVNEQLKFSPKNKLTRAQVCQLFFNIGCVEERIVNRSAIVLKADATSIAEMIYDKYPEYVGEHKSQTLKEVNNVFTKIIDECFNKNSAESKRFVSAVAYEISNFMANEYNKLINEEHMKVTVEDCYNSGFSELIEKFDLTFDEIIKYRK